MMISMKNIVTVYQWTHKKTSYTEVSHFNQEFKKKVSKKVLN